LRGRPRRRSSVMFVMFHRGGMLILPLWMAMPSECLHLP
jgi:hypothetical protein